MYVWTMQILLNKISKDKKQAIQHFWSMNFLVVPSGRSSHWFFLQTCLTWQPLMFSNMSEIMIINHYSTTYALFSFVWKQRF